MIGYKWQSVHSQLNALEAEIAELKAANQAQAEEIEAAMERLSQSERAMNTTLNNYQEQFAEQNQTIEGVKSLLTDRFDQLRTYLIVGVVALLLLVFVLVRAATAVAVKNHNATFNAFQESLFKSK